jgi:hypothetical protein
MADPQDDRTDPNEGRHAAGRHETMEDDREERDQVAAAADGMSAEDAPDVGDEGVPGVRAG